MAGRRHGEGPDAPSGLIGGPPAPPGTLGRRASRRPFLPPCRPPTASPGFGSLWSTVVLDLVGFGIVLPILPLWAKDLGASATTVGLILASYSLAQLVGSPVLGRLSDRIGRKPLLVLALTGSAVGHR